MYKALDLAYYIIDKCTRENFPVNLYRLLIILYLSQIRAIRVTGNRLFREEIHAYNFGPAVPSVYYRFLGYGAGGILGKYPQMKIDNKVKFLIDETIVFVRESSLWELNSIIHSEKGKWFQTYNGGMGDHEVIPIQNS